MANAKTSNWDELLYEHNNNDIVNNKWQQSKQESLSLSVSTSITIASTKYSQIYYTVKFYFLWIQSYSNGIFHAEYSDVMQFKNIENNAVHNAHIVIIHEVIYDLYVLYFQRMITIWKCNEILKK